MYPLACRHLKVGGATIYLRVSYDIVAYKLCKFVERDWG